LTDRNKRELTKVSFPPSNREISLTSALTPQFPENRGGDEMETGRKEKRQMTCLPVSHLYGDEVDGFVKITDEDIRDDEGETSTVVAKEDETTEKKTIICTTCFQSAPFDHFLGKQHVGTPFASLTFADLLKTCRRCRDNNKRADLKRDKDHVNALARVNEKKPERREVKQMWKDANPEKMRSYWMTTRRRLISLGVDNYLMRNAATAKEWRQKNPEKVAAMNEKKKTDLGMSYKIYAKSAEGKTLQFLFSFQDFEKLVSQPCFYCDEMNARGFNGIDRMDSSLGYTTDNCVACCTTCNFMKGSVSVDVFLKRVEHVLTNLGILEGKLFPECFASHKSLSFRVYAEKAKKREITFDLAEEVFNVLVELPCYICGKATDEMHRNGLDRVDNNNGYIEHNVQPCCGECNYMKRNSSFYDFIQKLSDIFQKNSEEKIESHNVESLENANTEENDGIELEKYSDAMKIYTKTFEDAKESHNVESLENANTDENDGIELEKYSDAMEIYTKTSEDAKVKLIGGCKNGSSEDAKRNHRERTRRYEEKLIARIGLEEFREKNRQKVARHRESTSASHLFSNSCVPVKKKTKEEKIGDAEKKVLADAERLEKARLRKETKVDKLKLKYGIHD